MSIVVPAVLPSSREDLNEKLAFFAGIPSVNRIQIDVVDGRFAAPASWPFSAEATQGKPTELETLVQKKEMLPHLDRIEYEIDLMCLDAELAAASWLTLGATRLTFHAETTTNLPRLLASAERRYGDGGVVSFGLALNIASDLALIEQCIGSIHYVQFMGINRIGRQGQPFDERVYEKVRIFHSRHPNIPIQVDGGISLERAKKLLSLDVSNLVIGSSILKAGDPVAALASFEALVTPYGV
ncbi:hypothetical protein A2118_02410 [Candidatus Kaiserbacteria bacterium GWA2_50_9]|uniref:Ribulose-phosphate 3-epimerase n=1 Tax=Candidatus Kaiserbacteria bacterium GWA2_50_9 TaxID=1798474 RepID=A0A1F6BXB6_9BACT|nr:MAG: hypothetical protein A2118_02410 [Candidatus Kaiserbacteria bacterium GWA2_50_9]